MKSWKPLVGGEELDELRTDIPPWMVESIWDWVKKRVCRPIEYSSSIEWEPMAEVLQHIENRCRAALDWSTAGGFAPEETALRSLKEMALSSDSSEQQAFLRVVDYMAHTMLGTPPAAELEEILQEGGSAFTVAHKGSDSGLQHRVDEETARRVAKVIEEGGVPGEHIAKAWHALYRRAPSPGVAYDEAVKAVEAAAAPIVVPDNSRPTLGVIISALRDKPEKWHSAISSGSVKGVVLAKDMMSLIWEAQPRHGEPSRVREVAHDQAEMALHLAITLVHWFKSGSIAAQSGERR